MTPHLALKNTISKLGITALISLSSCSSIQVNSLPYYHSELEHIDWRLKYAVDFNNDGKFDAIVSSYYQTVYVYDSAVQVPKEFGIYKGAVILTESQRTFYENRIKEK